MTKIFIWMQKSFQVILLIIGAWQVPKNSEAGVSRKFDSKLWVFQWLIQNRASARRRLRRFFIVY